MGTKRTDEFRADAVRIALTSGLTRRQVASDLGVGLSTLNKWVTAHRDTDVVSDKVTVELLALAHDRGCEGELAEDLERVLDAGQLPDPVALRRQFGPDPSDLPTVTVQQVGLDSYDALVTQAVWMGETA